MERHTTQTTQGRRILFWSDPGSPEQLLSDFMGKAWGTAPLPDPRDHIRRDIPYDDRKVVIKALQLRSTMNPTGGEVLMGYMGVAACRICKTPLGSRDLFGYGFIWPEKAEHYLDNHYVWHPDCDALLVAVRRVEAGRLR